MVKDKDSQDISILPISEKEIVMTRELKYVTYPETICDSLNVDLQEILEERYTGSNYSNNSKIFTAGEDSEEDVRNYILSKAGPSIDIDKEIIFLPLNDKLIIELK